MELFKLMIACLFIGIMCVFIFEGDEKYRRKHKVHASDYTKELAGRHLLRKFKVKNIQSSSLSAGFFLIAGGASSQSSEEINVTFSWMNRNGDYIISDLPKEQIRVRIDNTVKHPYVTFQPGEWKSIDQIYKNLYFTISYMTIHCSEKDYSYEVNLNNL